MKRNIKSQENESLKKTKKPNEKTSLKEKFIKYLKDHDDMLLANQIEKGNQVIFKPSQSMPSHGITLLIETLETDQNIIVGLDLSHRKITNLQINKLLLALQKNTCVKLLDLSGNNLDKNEKGYTNLIDLLKIKIIKDISLSFYSCRKSIPVSNILNCLKDCALTSLTLKWYEFSSEYNNELYSILKLSPSSLTSVRLRLPKIGFEDCKNLADALKSLPSLKDLSLAFNNCDDDGIKYVGETVNLLPQLTTCILNRSALFQDEQFATALVENHPNLTNLNFTYYNLDLSNADNLFKAIGSLNHLTALDLSNNNTLPNGLKNIASLLGVLPNLISLDLIGTQVGPSGINDLVEAITSHPNLTYINMPTSNLKAEHVKYIEEKLKYNFSITHIGIVELTPDPKLEKQQINKFINFNKKILTEVTVFISKYFLDKTTLDINDIPFQEWSAIHKYQLVSKGAIAHKFNELGKVLENNWTDKINNFINENYFLLTAICKNVTLINQNNDLFVRNPNIVQWEDQLTLPKSIVAHIASFLGDKNLVSGSYCHFTDNIIADEVLPNTSLEVELAGVI